MAGTSSSSFLNKLGLHRPELRAWGMYDWANSAFMTTIIAAVFPAYFAAVAGAGLPEGVAMARYGAATTISIVLAILIAPIIGTIADLRPLKKRLLAFFLGLGVLGCCLMFFIHQGDLLLAMLLFILGNVGIMCSFVLYEALLPHIAGPDEIDRVSTGGYALGYLGGGLLLALNLAWILNPALFGLPSGEGLSPAEETLPVRLAFVSVGVWWLLFSIPMFRQVPEPPVAEFQEISSGALVRESIGQLWMTLRDLKGYRQAFLMLLAFLIYNDGIGTIIRMATIYGTEIGIDRNSMIVAILITQFVGFPFAFLFGSLAGRIGARNSVLIGLVVYILIAVLAFFMTTASHFLILAIGVGMVQGGTQALSRSLFATIIPRHRSGEFFGMFGVIDRFAGALGSAMLMIVLTLGAPLRFGILSIALFFIVGGVILMRVDFEEGRRSARAHEAAAGLPPR
jgi:MFS transporter, UMF1 family